MIENRKLVLLFNTIDGHCHVTSVDSALEADPVWRVKVLIELGEGGEFISCEKFLPSAKTNLVQQDLISELSAELAEKLKTDFYVHVNKLHEIATRMNDMGSASIDIWSGEATEIAYHIRRAVDFLKNDE